MARLNIGTLEEDVELKALSLADDLFLVRVKVLAMSIICFHRSLRADWMPHNVSFCPLMTLSEISIE
jgi:hypothetical protein